LSSASAAVARATKDGSAPDGWAVSSRVIAEILVNNFPVMPDNAEGKDIVAKFVMMPCRGDTSRYAGRYVIRLGMLGKRSVACLDPSAALSESREF
jgi:hypothetical protein